MDKGHEDFQYVTDKLARTLFYLDLEAGKAHDTEKSIKYSKQFIEIADKYRNLLDEAVLAKKYFMVKNLVVSYFEKDDLAEARKYQDLLYKAYKKGELPEGINEYYNFEFFNWEGLNVWGYEWFEDLPKDRLSRSFAKIIYYIYSTNPDGSDKDQLYMLQVLMFHKRDNSIKFDYVLTQRIESPTHESGGTLYDYTYTDPIDIVKLRKDIREVVKNNPEPNVKSFRRK